MSSLEDAVGPVDIVQFWYSDRIRAQWFSSSSELDSEIRSKFEAVWESAIAGELDEWQRTPIGSLALVIICDQFPLNMFRGEPKSFQSEAYAITIAKSALDSGFETQLNKEHQAFLFMPLMHSEELKDQDLAVALFQKYELDGNLKFARHHREIVRRFGRFPHRNAILGRASSSEELDYLNSQNAFTG